jgi:hypothetical protein
VEKTIQILIGLIMSQSEHAQAKLEALGLTVEDLQALGL